MNQMIERLALCLAVAAALLAGFAGALREVPPVQIALRAAVAAGVVFGFVRFGGEMAGRSLLRGIAEDDVRRSEREKPDSGSEREAA